MIDNVYTGSVNIITIRCMTINLNLNLKSKFCKCFVPLVVTVYMLSVYVRLTLIITGVYAPNKVRSNVINFLFKSIVIQRLVTILKH